MEKPVTNSEEKKTLIPKDENILLSKKLASFPRKEEIEELLRELKDRKWVEGRRHGNDGSVGNTVEDFLGISENNFQTADAGNWELKAQRKTTGSMITLFHIDPQPRKPKSIVTNLLLPNYGWDHKTKENEKSFRATLTGGRYTDRGLTVVVDRTNEKIFISFDSTKVDKAKHAEWLACVERKVGLGEIDPQPFWTFDDLRKKTLNKIKNTFFLKADVKRLSGKEFFNYEEIYKLSEFDFDKFLNCIETGTVLIDFDARTGHNHGTKFRVRQDTWINIFDTVEKI